MTFNSSFNSRLLHEVETFIRETYQYILNDSQNNITASSPDIEKVID